MGVKAVKEEKAVVSGGKEGIKELEEQKQQTKIRTYYIFLVSVFCS